jgi:hypothetical protein
MSFFIVLLFGVQIYTIFSKPPTFFQFIFAFLLRGMLEWGLYATASIYFFGGAG